MAEFAVNTVRAKHRRRGQGCYEYRIERDGEIVAVCLTPENARRVYDALTKPPCQREHIGSDNERSWLSSRNH